MIGFGEVSNRLGLAANRLGRSEPKSGLWNEKLRWSQGVTRRSRARWLWDFGNAASDLGKRAPGREQRPDQSIGRRTGNTRFHLGNTGLTGPHRSREARLGPAKSESTSTQGCREREDQLDVGAFFRFQSEKIGDGADAPASGFQSVSFGFRHWVWSVHSDWSFGCLISMNCFSRRRQFRITDSGV